MSQSPVDREAARALLVARGLDDLAADDFLMRSLLTATEVATVVGVKNSRAARDTLRRWGVKPVSRGPGRTGENAYPAELVWRHQQNRPGRGWRKGQSAHHEKEATVPIETTTALDISDPWYSDHHEVVSLASVLVDAEWLSTPRDVVEFFESPWKWEQQHGIWAAAGRPRSPSSDDLVQARLLGGQGTLRRELERRYQDDAARWQALVESLNATDASEEPEQSDVRTPSRAASNVLPLRGSRKNRGRD